MSKIFFTEWFWLQKEITTHFEEISPQELNKCLQKCFFGKKSMDTAIQSSHNKIVIIGNSKWVKNHFCA